MCTDNYTLFPCASQGGEASSSRFRQEPVTVEEALRRHDGLVHAFIQRQGGGTISYEEALPSAVRPGLCMRVGWGSGGRSWATIHPRGPVSQPMPG
jgi:hypothetical protein